MIRLTCLTFFSPSTILETTTSTLHLIIYHNHLILMITFTLTTGVSNTTVSEQRTFSSINVILLSVVETSIYSSVFAALK